MRIKVKDLKRAIREAVADHMRLPRGPNSRDDSDDRPLSDPTKDRLNIEESLTEAKGRMTGKVFDEIIQASTDIEDSLSLAETGIRMSDPRRATVGIDRTRARVDRLIKYLIEHGTQGNLQYV